MGYAVNLMMDIRVFISCAPLCKRFLFLPILYNFSTFF